MSRRMLAVAVALLFFVQMITYFVGASMIGAFEAGRAGNGSLTVGVLMTTSSGIAVVGIGLLMYRVLKHVHRRLAIWYPALRVVELVTSATLGAYLLVQEQPVAHQHLWVYIPTGIGGLILTHLLYTSRLVPRAVAALGVVGYACLLLGVPLELLGLLETGEGIGMVLLAPGGLFEFLVLPAWLLVRGFNEPHVASPRLSPAFTTTR